jgi:hypothetical protein
MGVRALVATVIVLVGIAVAYVHGECRQHGGMLI